MTKPAGTGHSSVMAAFSASQPLDVRSLGAPVYGGERVSTNDEGGAAGAEARDAERAWTFEQIYEAYVDFVWHSLRRLGVEDATLDDAVQDAFVVVHRRLAEFQGRSSLKTWLFGIALRVAKDHRRRVRRKHHAHDPVSEALPDAAPGPHEWASQAEGWRVVHALLAELDDDRRAVFILAEIEQMTGAEIAEALGVNFNTVFSRLRAARQDFERALARYRRRHGG